MFNNSLTLSGVEQIRFNNNNKFKFPQHNKLCFYPSCGTALLYKVMQLDCDFFVFSDYFKNMQFLILDYLNKNKITDNNYKVDIGYLIWKEIEKSFEENNIEVQLIGKTPGRLYFSSMNKKAVLFFEDNNLVLERLRCNGLNIHHFLGICDGCLEGGNYECVHKRPFLKKVLAIAKNGMKYTTDHSTLLQVRGEYAGLGMLWNYKFKQKETFNFNDCNYHFNLDAVLITYVDSNKRLTPDDLVIFQISDKKVELEKLKLFRVLRGISRIAEFTINIENK